MSSTDSIKIKDTRSGLTTDYAWFTALDIQRELYESKTMPWGQAKMALYSIYNLHSGDKRAIGEQLKDDLKVLGSKDWTRPL